MDEIERRLRQGLESHGFDSNDPEVSANIQFVMRLISGGAKTVLCPLCHAMPYMVVGDSAFCGNEECKTLWWDRTKELDTLMMDVGSVSLNLQDTKVRKNPPGSGDPEREGNWPGS